MVRISYPSDTSQHAAAESKQIDLASTDFSGIFEGRLLKSWERALGIPAVAVSALQASPEFAHLERYFDIDRQLKTVGGVFEFGLDQEGRFTHSLLTGVEHGDVVVQASRRLVDSVLECLPRASLASALFDPDRLPEDLSRYNPNRLRKEVLRVIRDEIFPATLSAMLGHIGSPFGRADPGFDIRCLRTEGEPKIPVIEDVQVKLMRDDSPLLNPDSAKGSLQFWKLVSILSRSGNSDILAKALLLNQGASESKVDSLERRLVRAGVDPAQIIILDREDLRACGFEIWEYRASHTDSIYPVFIRMELQQFLRASCAAEFLGSSPSRFHPNKADDLVRALSRELPIDLAEKLAYDCLMQGPIELQLLKANGIWAVKERIETKKLPLIRKVA